MGTQKNNTQLNDQANAIYSLTDPKSIKGINILPFLSNLIASFANKVDDISLFGVKQHSPLKSYLAGELTVSDGRLGINRITGVGGATDARIHWMTPVSLLFEIPTWNSSPKANGAIVRYENSAFVNTIADNEDNPYDYGYSTVNVPMGYFGEQWQPNSVYKQGMIVSVDIDGRKVLIRNQNEGLMVSGENTAALKSEWNNGKWSFYAELEPSSPVELSGATILVNSDCGKSFYVQDSIVNVTLSEGIKPGWSAKFFSTSESNYVSFQSSGKLNSVGDKTDMIPFGTVSCTCVTEGEFNLFGNLN